MYKDIYQMPPQAGTKKLSLSISPSWPAHSEPVVHFDFYKESSTWTVYWPLTSMKESLRKKIRNSIEKQKDVKEMLDDQGFDVAVCDDRIICSHEVDTETGVLLDEVCENGLPTCVWKEKGFDGVTYKIVIDGFPDDYDFWCRLPAEWAFLKTMIDACVNYAKINKKVYACGVSKNRKEKSCRHRYH